VAYELEKEYLLKLPNNPLSSITGDPLDQLFFKAQEDLSPYHPRHITPRIVVLQAIYRAEADPYYEKLKKQGITSYSTKRGSISFGSTGTSSSISSEVIEILGEPAARGGRFYS
jgi:hypothetical protein